MSGHLYRILTPHGDIGDNVFGLGLWSKRFYSTRRMNLSRWLTGAKPLPCCVKVRLRWFRSTIEKFDDHRCQYCGEEFLVEELTFDHVIPVSQGGRKNWENIVTSCTRCNRRKGGRTPLQAGMRVIRQPTRPTRSPAVRLTFGLRNTPDSWRDYLYWNVELNET